MVRAQRVPIEASLDDLLGQIRQQHQQIHESNARRTWRRNRFESDIVAIAKNCDVNNGTSFDYDFCNLYQIFPVSKHELLEYELVVRISYVLDAYCTQWTSLRNRNPKNVQVVSGTDVLVERNPEEAIHALLKANEFFQVPQEWMNTRVEGVSLELSDPKHVTIYKCLFEDHDS